MKRITIMAGIRVTLLQTGLTIQNLFDLELILEQITKLYVKILPIRWTLVSRTGTN